MSAALLFALPALPSRAAGQPFHLDTRSAAAGPWLTRFNQWRASTGEAPVSENTTWSAGDYNHAQYMVMNDLVTHYETQGTPYYTAAGDTEARNSNIFVSSSTSTADTAAIDWWMGAPFHAMGMMDPRLSTTGFGSFRYSKSGWDMGAALDVVQGNSFSGGSFPVLFPANGTSEPLTSYSGNEFPDPLQACPGYTMPTGLPIFIEVGGNVTTTAGPVHTITGAGVSLNNCVIDSSNSSLGSYLTERGGVIMIPQRPLQTGVGYRVAMTVNGVAYTWNFMVGPFFSVSGVSPASGAATGGTTVTISGTGFTNATSVMFGTSPAASFTVINDSTITAVSPAHTSATVDVRVTTAYGPTPATSVDQFAFGCTSASLSPASGSYPISSVIAFTATSAGCAGPQYEFWVQDPTGAWTLKQGFGAATFSWATAGLAAGTYTVHAWVNNAGSGHDAVGEAIISLSACSSASLSPAAVTQPAGSSVALVASAGGCLNPLFEFWVLDPSGTWTLKQGFGGATFNWDTTGLAPGTYTVHAWISASGSGHDAIASSTVTLTGCTSALVAPATVTQPTGTTVSLTASAGGCPSPVYEFWVQYPDGSWNLKQGWGGSSFVWDTTGLAPGAYLVHAWANEQGAAPTLEVYGTANVTLNAHCASASVTPATVTQAAGTIVNLSATATGCTTSRFEFWVQYPDGSWNLKQGWGGGSFGWDTTGLAPGSYLVHAWANAGGTTWDAIGEATVTLTGCNSATVTPPSVSQAAETTVSMSAGSSGCPNPRYEFWVQYPDGSWNLKQGFGGATFNWDTSGLRPGVYLIHSWVNNQGAGHDAIGSATVTLTGCSVATVTSAASGTSVTFTATASGCPTPIYEFWLLDPAGVWHLEQQFSATNTWTWNTSGWAKGTYTIHVWTNNQGADTSTYETIGGATFTVA